MLDPVLSSRLSFLFSRIITPAWLLTGAMFKMYFDMPRALPQTIWRPAHEMGVNLQHLLHVIIATEFVLVGIMVFSRRWARLAAIVILTFFSLILINEVRLGSDSCGCMGKVHTPPLLILIIDGIILIGELLFKPLPKAKAKPEGSVKRRWLGLKPAATMMAAVWVVASFGVAFGYPMLIPEPPPQDPPPKEPLKPDPENGDTQTSEVNDNGEQPADPDAVVPDEPDPVVVDAPPAPRLSRPPDYYVPSLDEWVGKHWNELEIAAWVNRHPADINKGRRYVIFYNPTCDHCHDLLTDYFTGDLPVPTTVVAIPETKRGFERSGRYPMPCDQCEKLQLRFGCDWIIGPPLVVALEDGVVVCATEAEDVYEPQCLIWH